MRIFKRKYAGYLFTVNAKKEKNAKCMQSNHKRISAAQMRVTGKSRVKSISLSRHIRKNVLIRRNYIASDYVT